MSEQLSPEQVSENELICEKLLAWKQSSILGYWFPSPCHVGTLKTPSFTTWAEAGLILEALAKQAPTLVCYSAKEWALVLPDNPGSTIIESGPLAIRHAALEYIKAVKS